VGGRPAKPPALGTQNTVEKSFLPLQPFQQVWGCCLLRGTGSCLLENIRNQYFEKSVK